MMLSTFSLPDRSLRIYARELRFSVLTTAANKSVKKIHARMPLILELEDLQQ